MGGYPGVHSGEKAGLWPLIPGVHMGAEPLELGPFHQWKEIAMDLRLNALTSSALSGLTPASTQRTASAAVPGDSFADSFKTALNNVSAAQSKASSLQTQVQLGNPNVSLEETMLAMQKSQIGFQATLHVRNRICLLYTSDAADE